MLGAFRRPYLRLLFDVLCTLIPSPHFAKEFQSHDAGAQDELVALPCLTTIASYTHVSAPGYTVMAVLRRPPPERLPGDQLPSVYTLAVN